MKEDYMRRGVFIGIKIAVIALLLLAAACALDDPLAEDFYATVRYHSGVQNYLMGRIRAAQTSIKISLNRITVRQLIMELNDAAARGINVQLVVDSKQEASVAGISQRVDVASGNANGEMQSNFAIIDDTAIFFSDYDIANQNTLAISIRQKDLLTTLATEFGQMHDNKAYGSANSGGKAKQRINHQTVFQTSAGKVEMYFVPQNQALTYLRARMKQARKSVDVYAKYFNNEDLGIDFNDIAGSGLDNTFHVGNVELQNSLRYSFMMANPSNVVVRDDLPCNAVFVDIGMTEETLLFTTFPFFPASTLDLSDGIVLFVRGAGVQQLKAALDYQIEILPKYDNAGEGNVTSTIKIASFNMLKLGMNPKNYRELARVIYEGGFDVVGAVEVHATGTGGTDLGRPLSAGTTGKPLPGQTNYPQGLALPDVVANLEAFSGPDTWAYHVSPEPSGLSYQSGVNPQTGVTSTREFYGYVFKRSRIESTNLLGNYNDNPLDASGEFIRSPYGLRFNVRDSEVNFSLVMQHSHFGNPAVDPQREAALLYKVYEYFRNKPESGQNILLAGDFNLPADDPAFSTLYTTVDRITWAIHPSTLTSLGQSDFSSAYDNIFYSQNRNRVLMTGRGALRDWVTLTDYTEYGFTGENNFTYVRQYISDHVPVYITFNTSPDP
jgi:hypothetical protein